MKKRTLLTLVLSLAMVFSSISMVFAVTGAPTEDTKQAIVDAKVQSAPGVKDEVSAEALAVGLANQVKDGGYDLVDTATLKGWMDANKKMVIVDTMPGPDDQYDDWFSYRHIPGAVNAVVGAMNGPKFEILPAEKTALVNAIKAKVGTVKKYYYWNTKTKKWVTKKPAKKYWGKCTKKGDKHKGKKSYYVNVVKKNVPVVVYCGFTKCQRSHQAAMYLKQQGFKEVYRYAGGISAWVDAAASDPSYLVEGWDVAPNYVKMDSEEWDALGIDAGEITNADYVIDVRPDAQREANGYVPGAAICPVSKEYTPEEGKAIVAEAKKAGDARIVIVCVSGNMLAKNAMTALARADVNMDNVTYLKGGFGKWSENYPVVAPDKKSVSVKAWVTEGTGTNGELMMVKDGDGNVVEKCADMTHHILVNENGGNAPVALLNTKALPLQVYNALKEIGGKPYDKFNAKDQTSEFSLAGKGSSVNVTIDLGNGPQTLDYFFNHVTMTNAEIIADDTLTADTIPTEPYNVDMRFSGGLKNIKDFFANKSGNQTGCITCTFSCWIGTVSNGAYDYATQETKVIREHAPVGTEATVVYTIGE